jgi:hypothetical protein
MCDLIRRETQEIDTFMRAARRGKGAAGTSLAPAAAGDEAAYPTHVEGFSSSSIFRQKFRDVAGPLDVPVAFNSLVHIARLRREVAAGQRVHVRKEMEERESIQRARLLYMQQAFTVTVLSAAHAQLMRCTYAAFAQQSFALHLQLGMIEACEMQQRCGLEFVARQQLAHFISAAAGRGSSIQLATQRVAAWLWSVNCRRKTRHCYQRQLRERNAHFQRLFLTEILAVAWRRFQHRRRGSQQYQLRKACFNTRSLISTDWSCQVLSTFDFHVTAIHQLRTREAFAERSMHLTTLCQQQLTEFVSAFKRAEQVELRKVFCEFYQAEFSHIAGKLVRSSTVATLVHVEHLHRLTLVESYDRSVQHIPEFGMFHRAQRRRNESVLALQRFGRRHIALRVVAESYQARQQLLTTLRDRSCDFLLQRFATATELSCKFDWETKQQWSQFMFATANAQRTEAIATGFDRAYVMLAGTEMSAREAALRTRWHSSQRDAALRQVQRCARAMFTRHVLCGLYNAVSGFRHQSACFATEAQILKLMNWSEAAVATKRQAQTARVCEVEEITRRASVERQAWSFIDALMLLRRCSLGATARTNLGCLRKLCLAERMSRFDVVSTELMVRCDTQRAFVFDDEFSRRSTLRLQHYHTLRQAASRSIASLFANESDERVDMVASWTRWHSLTCGEHELLAAFATKARVYTESFRRSFDISNTAQTMLHNLQLIATELAEARVADVTFTQLQQRQIALRRLAVPGVAPADSKSTCTTRTAPPRKYDDSDSDQDIVRDPDAKRENESSSSCDDDDDDDADSLVFNRQVWV